MRAEADREPVNVEESRGDMRIFGEAGNNPSGIVVDALETSKIRIRDR